MLRVGRVGVVLGSLTVAIGLASAASESREMTPKQLYQLYKNSIVKVSRHSYNGDSNGTGFFVKNGQTIATCAHVTDGASDGLLTVTTIEGKVREIEKVIEEEGSDTAIIKLKSATPYKPIPIGSFSKVSTGDNVVIIGNPLGLERTLSTGIVSAKRSVEGVNMIQTNAAISSGSSGSPVINGKGEYIGFVSFKFTEGESLNMAVSAGEITKLLASGVSGGSGIIKLPGGGKYDTGKRGAGAAGYDTATGKTKVTIDACYGAFSMIGKALVRSDYAFDQIYNTQFSSKAAVLESIGKWVKLDLEALTAAEQRAMKSDPKLFGGSLKPITKVFTDLRIAVKKWNLSKTNMVNRYKPDDEKLLDKLLDEFANEWGGVTEKMYAFYELFFDKPWFPSEAFYRYVSPAVQYEMFGDMLDGIHADAEHDDGCYVSYSYEPQIKAGSKIVGVRALDSTEMMPTADWGQLAWRLGQLKDAKEVMVEVEGVSKGTFKVTLDR